MIGTMPVTTAEVVAAPTAAELRPDWMPRRQPADRDQDAETAPLNRPTAEVVRRTPYCRRLLE